MISPSGNLSSLLPGFPPDANIADRRSAMRPDAAPGRPRGSFSEQLDAAIGSGSDVAGSRRAVAAVLQRSFAAFVAFYTAAGSRIGESAVLDGLIAPLDGLSEDVRNHLEKCGAQAALQGHLITIRDGESTVYLAVGLPGRRGEALVVLCDSAVTEGPGDGVAECGLMLQLAASRLSHQELTIRLTESQRNAEHVAALVELVGLLETSRDADAAADRLARELLSHLQAARVMVGLCGADSSRCVLVADTGQQTIDDRSEATQHIEATLQESIAREQASLWPPEDLENRHALRASAQLAGFLSSVAVTACPVTDNDGNTVGAVSVVYSTGETQDALQAEIVRETALVHARDSLSFLQAAQHSLAVTFGLINRTSETAWQAAWRSCRTAFSAHRRRTMACITAVILSVLMLPVRYTIDCDAELQPVARRFLAAPFDGTLKECFVRPGDVVTRDMLLARMDEREIRWEIAGIQADLSRARNERDTHLADHKAGDAEIARHEMSRLKNRSELLSYRNDNLELRSPIDGIVVSGDHRDQEGVPLSTGDTMFEIAPMDAMIIEVAIPEEDVRQAQPGMPVRLQLDAMPATLFDAKILRIHPRAELKDQENVFIAEAEIDNTDGLLRPGMRGEARIRGERNLLVWNLFHKPVAHVVGWLGW